jgi:hydroxymethylpyrimidine kinase/phosphomethylpyrimidine kinase
VLHAFLGQRLDLIMRVVLSIAGFDPSGGAGVLADIKTLAAFGCFGAAVVTSLTSQNTTAVYGAYHQPPEVLRAQLEPVISDYEIAAVKTGLLPTRASIEVVAETIQRHQLVNVVVDPVIRSTSGYDLMEDEAAAFLAACLLPLADVMTPNLAEAARLTHRPVKDLEGMKQAARQLHEQCKTSAAKPFARRAVLITGGHLADEAADVLYDGEEMHIFHAPKIATRQTHGTGCTLSSAIAALLAQGYDLSDAVQRAKDYVVAAMRTAPNLGHGAGPLNHFGMSQKCGVENTE